MFAFLDALTPGALCFGGTLALTAVNLLRSRYRPTGIDAVARLENARLRQSLDEVCDELARHEGRLYAIETEVGEYESRSSAGSGSTPGAWAKIG